MCTASLHRLTVAPRTQFRCSTNPHNPLCRSPAESTRNFCMFRERVYCTLTTFDVDHYCAAQGLQQYEVAISIHVATTYTTGSTQRSEHSNTAFRGDGYGRKWKPVSRFAIPYLSRETLAPPNTPHCTRTFVVAQAFAYAICTILALHFRVAFA